MEWLLIAAWLCSCVRLLVLFPTQLRVSSYLIFSCLLLSIAITLLFLLDQAAAFFLPGVLDLFLLTYVSSWGPCRQNVWLNEDDSPSLIRPHVDYFPTHMSIILDCRRNCQNSAAYWILQIGKRIIDYLLQPSLNLSDISKNIILAWQNKCMNVKEKNSLWLFYYWHHSW